MPATAAPAELPLAGRIVAISAGGTREPLDPVRYLGNRSSGRQGIALAKAAMAAGARVRFIAAHMDQPAPEGVELSTASTARQLQAAVNEAARGADVLIMSAAVADFRPAEYVDSKIKKSDEHAGPGHHPGPQPGHPGPAGRRPRGAGAGRRPAGPDRRIRRGNRRRRKQRA